MQQMGIERKGMPKQKGKKIKSERRKRREVKKEGKRRKGNEEKKREREVRKKNIKMKMRRGGKKTFFPALERQTDENSILMEEYMPLLGDTRSVLFVIFTFKNTIIISS